jgi:polyisoprenoid-binding protein YceI
MTTFRIVPGRSKVWIEAKSSLHPIHGEAGGLEGSIDTDVADGQPVFDSNSKIRIELPVEALKSGKSLEDAEMMKRIEARRYPTIRGEVREISHDGDGRYRIRGDLTFHGITQTVDGEVSARFDGENSLVIEGEHIFDIRDFGVQPPKILMLKVHPDVSVRIRVVAEPEGS